MLFFPIYAMIIWAGAMYWRRKWPALAITAAGVLLLLIAGRLFIAYEHLLPSGTRLFHELLWPYTLFVGAMGFYIALLPRPAKGHECKRCRYDLRGLDPHNLICPECGEEWCGIGSGREPPPVDLIPIPKGPPKKSRSL